MFQELPCPRLCEAGVRLPPLSARDGAASVGARAREHERFADRFDTGFERADPGEISEDEELAHLYQRNIGRLRKLNRL